MNDTHGETGKGWYGFDLDGTLAKYDGWKGIDHIGEPVKPMVELIKRMHDEGKIVKIMTARVAPRKLEDGTVGLESTMISSEDMRQFYNGKDNNPFENGSVTHVRLDAKEVVAYWCSKNLGFIPEIVYQRDHLMLDLYDDRCHQVVPNVGVVVAEQYEALHREYGKLRCLASELASSNKSLRWWERVFWASVGASLLVGFVAIMASVFKADHPDRVEADRPACVEAEERLRAALSEYIEAKGPGFLPPRGLGLEVR